MDIKHFKNNVITQKNVITHLERVTGGNDECCGTNTSRETQTEHESVIIQILGAASGVSTTTTDHSNDWDDEGCC